MFGSCHNKAVVDNAYKWLTVTLYMNPDAEAVLTTSSESVTQEVPVGSKNKCCLLVCFVFVFLSDPQLGKCLSLVST